MSQWEMTADAQVVTSDGRALGAVGAVTRSCFQVAGAANGHDAFWLHVDCVLRADPTTIRLVFPFARLADYRLAAPAED